MARTSIRPPFAWLGQYSSLVSVIVVVGIGAFFRFYQIASLPPGTYDSAARIGLQALDLIEHGRIPGLDADNGYAPLFVWLQSISIKLLGHTELALRLWPALLGSIAVFTAWLWARSWFGPRIGWLTAFLLAVTPWAVTLSRNDIPTAIMPLLGTLTLWLATRAWRNPAVKNNVLLAAVLLLDLLCGPAGWVIAGTIIVAGAYQLARTKRLFIMDQARAVGLGALALALAIMAYMVGVSLPALKSLPQTLSLTSSLSAMSGDFAKTLLMFNVHGDENFRHNLSGEPMLNVFVGIMLIAGLLVTISRLHRRPYAALLAFTLVFLLPAVVSGQAVPNAARAILALPMILALAAIGISYMMELWYATFPINSAARATGQSAIIVLLGLSAFQGYTQYFRAWAGSSQVYAAYNEPAAELASRMPADKFAGTRYVVASSSEQPVISYLGHGGPAYQAIEAGQLAGLPVSTTPREFLITASSRDQAMKTLKIKLPGGILRPHYSKFNQAEIFYTYELTK